MGVSMIPHASQLAPLVHPRLDIFLLGYIAAGSAVIALFFFRFWRETRDFLFLAFAVFFSVQGGAGVFTFSSNTPNIVVGWIFGLWMLAVVLVIVAILRKNARNN
jgi:hypothetical protein